MTNTWGYDPHDPTYPAQEIERLEKRRQDWNQTVTSGNIVPADTNVYQRAWELLLERIEAHPGPSSVMYWDKTEVRKLMLQCLVEAGKP